MIDGDAEPGFGPVADAFAANFADGAELGAAVSVYVDGRNVVNLWGGVADATNGRPWREDTSALAFSCTKGLVAICAHQLAQAGQLDLDAPVSRYWPEFGRNGKHTITTRCLLSHRAGLLAIDGPLSRAEFLGWTAVIEALEAQAPLWEPGTAFAYHPITWGHLAGEVIRRVTGLMPGDYFAREIAIPLGVGTRIGLSEDDQEAVARLEPLPAADREALVAAHRESGHAELLDRSVSLGAIPSLFSDEFCFNDPDIRAAQLPAANAITTAHDLAKVYSATVTDAHGPRLLAPATIADATIEQSAGLPCVGPQIDIGLRWGTGFMLHSPPQRPLLTPASFGHDGAGGALGFADPDLRVGFGYVNNRMGGIGDQRANRLTAAVAACLHKTRPARRSEKPRRHRRRSRAA